MINRRRFFQLAGLAPLLRGFPARADDLKFSHAVSLFDDIKYPAGFKQFGYVNAGAPKGGRFRLSALGTFDSLNPYTVKGDPVAIGVLDQLMVAGLDEPATRYPLIAETIAFPDDKSRCVFRLNAAARFHDGKVITPEDVIFSLDAMKNNLASSAAYYKNVSKAEQTGEHEVTFVFAEKNNRELPSIVSELIILPKHWWSANGPDGKPRDINAASMELPLGSGAYKYKSVSAGASVTLERVGDYWAKDLAVNVGQNNFDELVYEYFQSPQVSFEGFKGDQFDYQYETSSKQWATGYDFPAIASGKVVKEEITLKQVHGLQAYVLNLRKPQFQDIRVRRALNLAFDFEWANTNLFYGQYRHARSLFNNSELEATGLPSPEELKLLEPLKDKLPPEVFTTEYQNPSNPDPTTRRKNLRLAAQLLADAGWKADEANGKTILKNAKGETLGFEFTLDNPLFERITLPYVQDLAKLGIVATVRSIDEAQFKKLQDTFDFEVIVASFGQSLSPGNEQRDFWGTAAADKHGSRNLAGIKNEAIDKLIENLIFVKDRNGLLAACRALDRAVMWNSYFVPQWFGPTERIAHWDRFGRPDKAPDYGLGVPTTWWWDEAKAKKISG